MPKWSSRFRSAIPRSRRGGWVQPGNVITRAIERELEAGLPAHLPSQPDPVPGVVITKAEEDRPSGLPSSAA
ncbi:MAG: hypothetical protein CL897_06705 [Dehalococcoidia bacterium]|nr:hypothetical protein [Dehalococcoidia bacterium]